MTTCCKRAGLALALAGWMFTAVAAPQRGDTFPAWDRLRKDTADARVVLVDFCASWCAPCKASFPELDKLETDYATRGFKVLAISVDDKAAAMQAFLKEHPVVYPIAIIDVYSPPADFETPRGLPMTYLIAPDGKVARQFLGPVTAREIETAIANNGGPKLEG